MRTITRATLLALLVAVTAMGCGKPTPASSDESEPAIGTTGTNAPTADHTAKAKEIFGQRCTPCHGPAGAGDGPASASLTPHPRDFHDKAWQKSVTDQHIETIIKVGGAAVGKSPAMPGNPNLSDPALLAALRDVIRGFGS